jgi:hypothetical protein
MTGLCRRSVVCGLRFAPCRPSEKHRMTARGNFCSVAVLIWPSNAFTPVRTDPPAGAALKASRSSREAFLPSFLPSFLTSTGSGRSENRAQDERKTRLGANGKPGFGRTENQAQDARKTRLGANGKPGWGGSEDPAQDEWTYRLMANGSGVSSARINRQAQPLVGPAPCAGASGAVHGWRHAPAARP